MQTMKKLTIVLILMCSMLFIISSEAQRGPQRRVVQRGVVQNTQKELPFYFPEGMIQTSDPVDQFAEYQRFLAATSGCNQGDLMKSGTLLADNRAIKVETDIDSTSSITNNKAKLEVVFDNQVRVGDKIRVTMLCGQQFITEDQFKIEKDDFIEYAIQARDADYEYYQDLTERAIKARAEKLGIKVDEFKKILDDKDPNYGITFRELHRIPNPMKRSDFMPRELHLGYNTEIPGIFGVTWLNTGVVYINPQARMLDYLIGKPVVSQHEFIHSNSNMQKFPMSGGFDAELFASIPEMLIPEDQIDLFFHSYPRDLRELAWIYFGFNYKQVRKEITKFDFAGSVTVDEEKYRHYFSEQNRIKKEMYDFFRDVVLPEFYSDPLWWSAMNERRGDQNSIFRIMMAGYYDPTIFGGHVNTMKWLSTIPEDKLKDMARSSFEEQGDKSNDDFSSGMKNFKAPQFLIDQYKRLFTEKEQNSIREYFVKHLEVGERIMKMNFKEILKFLKQISGAPAGGVR